MGGGNSIADKNTSKLAAGLGYNRFMSLLKNKNLENVVYAFGTLDEQVGRLSTEEINFLTSKEVRVIAIDKDHTETIDGFSEKYLNNIVQ